MKKLILSLLILAGIHQHASSQVLTVNNFLPCSVVGVELYADDAANCSSVLYTTYLLYIEVGETIDLDFSNPNSPTGSGLSRWNLGGGTWTPPPSGNINIIGARVFNPCSSTPGICSFTGNPYDEATVWDACTSFPSTGVFNFDVVGCSSPPPPGFSVSFCDDCASGSPVDANVVFSSGGGNWDITVYP